MFLLINVPFAAQLYFIKTVVSKLLLHSIKLGNETQICALYNLLLINIVISIIKTTNQSPPVEITPTSITPTQHLKHPVWEIWFLVTLGPQITFEIHTYIPKESLGSVVIDYFGMLSHVDL